MFLLTVLGTRNSRIFRNLEGRNSSKVKFGSSSKLTDSLLFSSPLS